MAAIMALGRELGTLAGMLAGVARMGTVGACVCQRHRLYPSIGSPLSSISSSSFHIASVLSSISPTISVTEEPDMLLQKVSVLVKSHDPAVLDSYEFFTTTAAKELGITVSRVYTPPKDIDRLTVLKSIHIFKKHRVQYEMRTHYRCIEVSHLTGCTAQVYLEYIQRNLPEGVAMEVTKTAIEKIPEHILQPIWKDQPSEAQ